MTKAACHHSFDSTTDQHKGQWLSLPVLGLKWLQQQSTVLSEFGFIHVDPEEGAHHSKGTTR
jgi:hypothetical protein